jgi:hypothetical protein
MGLLRESVIPYVEVLFSCPSYLRAPLGLQKDLKLPLVKLLHLLSL